MKRYTIEILKPAELEIKEACEWYDKRQPDLAADLLNEINHNFDRIVQTPLLFPIRYNKIHRVAILKRFPYLVIFRLDESINKIYVISVFHTSRSPQKFDEI